MNPYQDTFTFTDKWGEEVDDFKFTQIPNLLIYCQGHLGLTDGELVTLLQLISHWFAVESEVFPAIRRLASYSNNSQKTVSNRLKHLEEKRFISRAFRSNDTSIYSLEPCVKKLLAHVYVCPDPPINWAEYPRKMGSRLPQKVTYEEYKTKKMKKNMRIKDTPLDFSLDNCEPIV